MKAGEDTLKGKKRRAGETKEEGDKKKKIALTHTHTRISSHHTDVKVHITHIHTHA